MSDIITKDPMLEMFLFETSQLVEQLEQSVLNGEKENSFHPTAINEIFRIMHTIKGSAAMMMFQSISSIAHSLEDIFYFLREGNPKKLDYSILSDLVLEGIDFIKIEVEKVQNQGKADGNADKLINSLHNFLEGLKEQNPVEFPKNEADKNTNNQQFYISKDREKLIRGENNYKAVLFFEDGCEMENIRAYTVIHNLKDITRELIFIPENILDNDISIEIIRQQGFKIYFSSDYSYEEMYKHFMQTIFLKDLELHQRKKEEMPNNEINDDFIKGSPSLQKHDKSENTLIEKENHTATTTQSIISVSVSKLDKLMDLVGEMVIAEAMVIQNPEIQGLELDSFQKAARQLGKITGEIQDMVMAIRMVPLSATFQKMNRIVRDMSKKLEKEVKLNIIGEETEVDKNIIEHISDPIMHLVRNAIDHGLESTPERQLSGKSSIGTITMEAKSAGGDVLIIVRDDGKGLNKEKILKKAREQGLLSKLEEEITDKEVYNLILLPGFSTNENVTEFSGRGVGLDVVTKNIEEIGGSLSVESTIGRGTVFTLKLPLTLAIIDGMNIKIGESYYTLPTNSIKESFRPKEKDIIKDPDNNEMIMVRGQCHPILRLHKFYKIETPIVQISQGIIIMVEQEEKYLCIFADELIGQQQVVVKALPKFIQEYKKIKGLAGCTLLGDGSISLILDVNDLINM